MPLTAAERMRKYRQKIKEDRQKDLKQLAKDRKRKSEAKENMTTEQLAEKGIRYLCRSIGIWANQC